MAKKTKVIELAGEVSEAVANIILGTDEKPFVILEASIKDDFCNYQYQITKGVGLGDTHKVNGSGIILDSLRHAFGQLNVHLAAIDDVFKHNKVEIEDIDTYHADELATLYNVTGFKIKGGREDESVILIGSKYVSSSGGRIELASPRIPLDNLSSYAFHENLKEAVDEARRQVALYKEGQYTAVDEDEVDTKPNPRQLKITDNIAQDDDDNEELASPQNLEHDLDNDFESAKI